MYCRVGWVDVAINRSTQHMTSKIPLKSGPAAGLDEPPVRASHALGPLLALRDRGQ